jgi:hypothetical protein
MDATIGSVRIERLLAEDLHADDIFLELVAAPAAASRTMKERNR